MKLALLAIFGGASLLHAPALFAKDDVLSRYARWEQRLRTRVDDQLAYPLGVGSSSGDVLVRFGIGRDGKPSNARLERSSGYPFFDQAALGLVSRLGRLGPVPSANGLASEVVLKISYGDSASSAAASAQVARADRQEQTENQLRARASVSGASGLAERH